MEDEEIEQIELSFDDLAVTITTETYDEFATALITKHDLLPTTLLLEALLVFREKGVI